MRILILQAALPLDAGPGGFPGAVLDFLAAYWPYVSAALGVGAIAAATWAGAHAVLSRRDVRSTIGWLGLISLVPLLGAILYAVFGVNRIRRRALTLKGGRAPRYRLAPGARASLHRDLGALLAARPELVELAHLTGELTTRPLVAGNEISMLSNGDEAYPAMLEAIEGAEHSVTLATYIFDHDAVGKRFVDALVRAHDRGVRVRVLIDAAGSRYSRPRTDKVLKREGVNVARFMPLRMGKAHYLNLRNHRKVLVVDGEVGFTGGMNIRRGHVLSDSPRSPVRDVHFRLRGPVVAQLQEVFAEDWEFSTGESLSGDLWFPVADPYGPSLARVLADGPDEDLDTLTWALLGAIGCAERSIRIVTPYFLPDPPLATALNVAALRGVRVEIILPEKNNLPYVGWAMWGSLWSILGHGVKVFMTPPPFDHSKLVVVDDFWTFYGSTNWDPRSLRLNFEMNVETYCPVLAGQMAAVIDGRLASAREITADELRGRPLLARVRDGLARLLTPYI